MKYQEKVSNPPPAVGRGPYPDEMRITNLLISRSLEGNPKGYYMPEAILPVCRPKIGPRTK
jgi:hypothetical protein